MERELTKLLVGLTPKRVLDMGAEDAPYRNMISAVQYVTVDITADHGANLVSDISNLACRNAVFDLVLATEVLEHCREPKQAISELRRVLVKGGACIITTRFIHPYHPTPNDYYRFTWDSLNDIFSEFDEIKLVPHGNTLQSMWTLLCAGRSRLVLNLLNPVIARINTGETVNPCGFLVFAIK
jgi:SAM-dependent methyltransferase